MVYEWILSNEKENTLKIRGGTVIIKAKREGNITPNRIDLSPFKILIIISLSIFFAEMIVMIRLSMMPGLSEWSETLFDSSLLILLISPVLYFFLYRPLVLHIAERKKAEETLEESEKKYRTLIENIQDGVFIIQDSRIQFANDAFARMVGYSVEEVVGRDFLGFVAPEDLEMVEDRYNRRKAGEVPKENEFRMLHRDGKKRISINMNFGFITYHGRIASMGTVKDISDQKEKRKLEMQLLQSDKLATIQLAAGAAHEINNRLGNISLYSQILLKKTEDNYTKDKLMVIGDEVNRAAKIVKGMLDFARQSDPKLSRVDINKEIDKVFSIMNPTLRDIKVNTFLSPLPLILADSHQIKQVITNLLLNSIQAITENGEIIVKTRAGNDSVEISISDNGCGIPTENLDKIFDPFFTTKERGTGLGLSICSGIIKRHNGSIDVESEVGKGTTFTVKLPMSL